MAQSKSFRTVIPVSIHGWLRNNAQRLKGIHKVPCSFVRSYVKSQGHKDHKIEGFDRIERFRTVTPIWIHQCLPNDAHSLKWYKMPSIKFQDHTRQNRQCLPELSGSGLQLQLNSQMDGYKIMHRAWRRMRSVLLFFRIIHQISRSDVPKNYPFSSYLSVSGWYLYFEFTGGYQMTHVAFMDMEEVFRRFEVICQISMSHGAKNDDFLDLDPIWAILLGRSQLSNSPDLPCSLLTIKQTFCPRPYISFNQYIVW